MIHKYLTEKYKRVVKKNKNDKEKEEKIEKLVKTTFPNPRSGRRY